ELIVEAGEIEMDQRVLQAMKDPLLHLIRNSIDHGVEFPQERLDCQKPAISTLTITAQPRGGNLIEIAVADDGRGINLDEVKAVAIKANLVSPATAARLNDQQLLGFTLDSGFSTRSQTTDVSGRGLGLAILRERVEHLEGTISIETRPGSGTTFRILLPLTLANFRGMLIEVCGRQFIVPTAHIESVVQIE